ncbi:sodium-dependent transporter [Thermococcus zilligii]|uniref:sodium-dependent transporter n=1 Tax=Thermococcus zilligii TaxID=54076 RepID=UPI00029AA223|nr:sodium-dependent transporter [Thermococcus zilligii]
MRKMSALVALLITGYILGIWNFLLMPKYYIIFGLKGFLVSLIVLGLGLLLIHGEINTTRTTRYLAHEFMFKVSKLPALTLVLLMFLMLSGGVVLYYSARAILPIFDLSDNLLLPIMAGVIVLIIILLAILRGRSVEFLGAMAVLLVVFTPLATLLLRSKVYSFVTSPRAADYLNFYRQSVFSLSSGLDLNGLVLMGLAVILALGLGAGVYYVLGSFLPEGINIKRILAFVVLLQVFLSFSAAMTTVYSIGVAYQGHENAQARYNELHNELGEIFLNPNYTPEEAMGKAAEVQMAIREVNKTLNNFNRIEVYSKDSLQNPITAVETFYLIPTVIRDSEVPGGGLVIALLMGSLFLAGFTSLVVLVEIGGQISGEVFQTRRTQGILFVGLTMAVLGGIMVIEGVRIMLTASLIGFVAFMAVLEAFPLLRGIAPVNRTAVIPGIAVFLLLGVLGVAYLLKLGGTYLRLGLLVGLLLLAPLLFNGYLLTSARGR